MENTYCANTTPPLCYWHHNPNIVGQCTNCGAFICEKCSLPTPNGRSLCPDCFQSEYAYVLKETSRMKISAIALTLLGIFTTLFLYLFSYYQVFVKNNFPLEDVDLNMIAAAYDISHSNLVLFVICGIFMFIISTFFSIGFFFGLRKVINKMRTFSVFFIIISVLFFVIVLALILQISWWIGGFVMLNDYIRIHNNKKVLNRMNETYNFYRLNL